MTRLHTALVTLAFVAAPNLPASIVINEIHYAPRDKMVPEEFVELYNSGPDAVDLGGWHFSDGIAYTFSAGTSLAVGEYLVVAQDPPTLRSTFPGVRMVGPFLDRLSNDGEEITLRDNKGLRVDEVSYQRGFPWPTVSSSTGYSIELIHPDLDNNLGGSWRASNPDAGGASSTLVAAAQAWQYRKGTAEASTPTDAWRAKEYNDATWSSGTAPVGYGEAFIGTDLGDMRGNYTSFFLRQTFTVTNASEFGGLALEALFDDGFNAWINGVHVLNANMPSANVAFNGLASSTREVLDFERYQLPPTAGYLVSGTNVLCVQLHNISLDTSSDGFFDCRLVTSAGGGAGPSPGARNHVYADNLPPHLRQVEHTPKVPVTGEPIVITVKATDLDGVAAVTLEYQVVNPGAYIEITDPAFATQWTALPMNDAGQNGDALAADTIFSATVPPDVQEHRRLVRYRLSASDNGGRTVRAPYADDPQPNFAYFVQDGASPWFGAIEPGSANATRSRVVEYPGELLDQIPTYHLIARNQAVEDSTWNTRYGGDNYPWRGTLVVDGEVYDHIGFRARGGVWRYAMGKNMWKFDFLTGHDFKARDNFGRAIKTSWRKVNFSACIQQGDYLHRGEQGMFEAAGFRLFELAGLEASKTFWVNFRVIDDAEEFGVNQYDGDFWGLYLVIEQLDGRFLDEHKIPDGNFYKMEGGTGELNNLGPLGPADKSDLNEFINTYSNSTPSDDWWRSTFDLTRYYNYRAIVEAIHHGDIGYGKNYFYYSNPETGLWSTHAWDLDLTWADNMFGDGNSPFKSRVITRPAFNLEYKNRLREIRDLLYNTTEGYKLIEELAGTIDDTTAPLALVDADRARWDFDPILANGSIVNLSKAGQGRFYQRGATKDFRGMVKIMRDYVVSRGAYIDNTLANDTAIPRQPTITYAGPPGFPIDALSFTSSDFSDPQGAGTFGALRWRVAEVSAPGAPAFEAMKPKLYEINTTWQSPELATFVAQATIPSSALKVGSVYRVRVRHKDATGRWSKWSNALEFTASPPTTPFPQQATLRITEVHFHPTGELDEEFIEVANTGETTLDLTSVTLGDGVEFQFANGSVTSLGGGERVVVVENAVAFRARYGTTIKVAGEYQERLANGGESLALVYGGNVLIQSFAYDDTWYPLADGGGSSLEIIDELAPVEAWNSLTNWRASAQAGGTPGTGSGGPPPGGLRRPGDSNQDGQLDVADAVSLLWRLFIGELPLPCNGSGLNEGGNLTLLDVNGSGSVNLTDAVAMLNYLFLGGAPPSLGTACVRIDGCSDACSS